jgi:hypothetical protein
MPRLLTRGPGAGEPQTPLPIYVRLGMTRGAFVAVLIILAGGIGGFARLESIAASQRHVAAQARTVAIENRRVLDTLRGQQRRNVTALREVCRQTQTLQQLARAGDELVTALITFPQTPRSALPRLTAAAHAFRGYQVVLSERPACSEVLRP